jgi:hypothetical protein
MYDAEAQSVGLITLDELHRLIAQGVVGPETLVWAEGMPGWLPCNEAAAHGFTSHALPVVNNPALKDFDPRPLAESSSAQPASGLAVASLVLSLVGWTCGVGSLLALVIGIIALGRLKASQGQLEGKSLAMTGVLLGAAGVVVDVALALTVFMLY